MNSFVFHHSNNIIYIFYLVFSEDLLALLLYTSMEMLMNSFIFHHSNNIIYIFYLVCSEDLLALLLYTFHGI